MVDCRAAGAGAPPHELPQSSAANGGPPAETHNTQGTGGSNMGDGGNHSQSSAASTPPNTNVMPTYSGVASGGGMVNVTGTSGVQGVPTGPPPYIPGGCAPYMYKSMMWCTPQSPPPAPLGVGVGHGPPPPLPSLPTLAAVPHVPPPPLGINPHVFKSVQANGADLPMNDIPTLRYYFNLGVDCMWATYGAPPPQHALRHYSPRDLSQDMQNMSMQDRGGINQSNSGDNQKHKPSQGGGGDKPSMNNQGKGNGQRPLLGPRFKRGGNNQDGNQNLNHQNKGHNNMGGHKGPNNRRNSHGDGRCPPGGGYGGHGGAEGGECVVDQPPPVLTLPYIPYPPAPAPPVYPIQYYPIEADPGMLGMMGGMGYYMSHDEGIEYGQQYYGAPHHYPPPPPPPPHHQSHHHHQPQPHQHHMDPK